MPPEEAPAPTTTDIVASVKGKLTVKKLEAAIDRADAARPFLPG